MKIFVVGAHGQIGQLLVHKLLDRGDTVTGGYRDPIAQTPDPEKNFRAVELDLSWPVDRLADLYAGHDAIVFAAGSRGQDLLGVDLDGAVKTMKAAERADISRFIMLSALDAEDPDKWPDQLHDYYIAKYYADDGSFTTRIWITSSSSQPRSPTILQKAVSPCSRNDHQPFRAQMLLTS